MKLIFTILAVTAAVTLSARQTVKLTGQKEVLTVQKLTVNADGSLSYVLNGTQKTAPANTYDYARIPKPREITEAEKVLQSKDYIKAEKLFQIAFEKYRLLGWGIYCITRRAEALDGAKRLKDALAFLEQLKGYTSLDPEVRNDVLKAKMLYVDLLMKSGDLTNAGIIAESLLSEKSDDAVFFALERKGDIALKKKEKKTAVRNYLQAIFLIPGHQKRPDVLYKTILLLKEMKDKRWEKLAEILKKQHPDSQFAKKI